jgi:hypothetical protein
VLEIQLDPGEAVWAEPGRAAWLTDTVQLRTTTAGGLWGTLRRALGGGSAFLTAYEAPAAPGRVAFTATVPGVILPVDLPTALPNLPKSPSAQRLGLELSYSAFDFLAAGGMIAHPPADGPRHLPDA